MRIGIDYTAAVRQGGGIGRYTRNLIRALAEKESRYQYTLFVAGGWSEEDRMRPWPANFRLRSVPLSDRWMHVLWQRLRLPVPIQAIIGPLDLFHSPDFVLPPTGRTPAILTVHDLSFMRVPQYFVPGFRQYLQSAVSRAAQRARHILADSASTRRDLIELMSIESNRVSVLYPGVEARFRPVRDNAELAKIRSQYKLPERFILGLSTLQPRKNFDGLIKAFRILLAEREDTLRIGDLHLVIVGGKGWMYEETMALVQGYGLEQRIHFPGFANDSDLPAIYSLAEVFAFPSWYEGFGIPVLEAMACGVPVVAADNSSLPEAVGDAGLLVDAADIHALAEALAQLLTDQLLRARLIQNGYQQAQRFSWEEAAQQLLSTYKATQKDASAERL